MKQAVIFFLIMLFSCGAFVPQKNFSIIVENCEIPFSEESDFEKKIELTVSRAYVKSLRTEPNSLNNFYYTTNQTLSKPLTVFLRSAYFPLFILYESFRL